MILIIEWVRNLIVFIIFVAILDMLVPSSSLGKYVRFVIGLLLLVLLLTPLFDIFKMPVQQTLEELIFSPLREEHGQSRLEEKKIEIQSQQHAYILEQMAVQLKKQVNPILKKDFQVEMVSGTFDATVSDQNVLEEIHGVSVVVQAQEQLVHDVSAVESIKIGEKPKKEKEQNQKEEQNKAIQAFFAKQLNVDAEKIEVIQKGEES